MKQTLLDAIMRERKYQDLKHGTIDERPHEVGAWLTILRTELREAEEAWASKHGDEAALREILQIATVAVACMEQHGVVESDNG